MSWTLAYSKCWVLTGKQHVSTELFAETIVTAYHETIQRHVDLITAGALTLTIGPDRKQQLYTALLAEMNKNRQSGDNSVNLFQQIEPFIYQYWSGAKIIGPLGTVDITFTGSWINPWIKQNLSFSIILLAFIVTAKLHLATLVGIYKSSMKNQSGSPLIISPWSGLSLQTIP